MRNSARRARTLAAVVGAGLLTLTACGGGGSTTGAGASGTATTGGQASAKGGTIALLLPESKTTRYESFDRPYFEQKVKAICPSCTIVYANADQDAAKQQQQAESALTQGAKVMVLDPVDSAAAASIVTSAHSDGVPVIAYDRFIRNAPISYYISFDNEKVGRLQGQALVDKLKADGAKGGIVMINGSPTDNNAGQFKKGAHSVLDSSGYKILAEYDTPDWSPDKAQTWMSGQLTQLPKDQLVGVYAANDGTAGGAIAAMKAAGVSPIPPVTGQDAELAAIQRILSGDQYMTVYKAIRPEADQAAQLAVSLLRGEKPAGKAQVEGIPSFLLEPVAVTKDTVKDTVVKDGFYTVNQICTPTYAKACAAAGLS